MQVMMIQHTHIICASDWDTMGPGQPNQPAGSRRFRDSVWDELGEEEE